MVRVNVIWICFVFPVFSSGSCLVLLFLSWGEGGLKMDVSCCVWLCFFPWVELNGVVCVVVLDYVALSYERFTISGACCFSGNHILFCLILFLFFFIILWNLGGVARTVVVGCAYSRYTFVFLFDFLFSIYRKVILSFL